MPPPAYYLFASRQDSMAPMPDSVFYKVDGEFLAKSLCEIVAAEVTCQTKRVLSFRPAIAFTPQETEVFDEAIDLLLSRNGGSRDSEPGPTLAERRNGLTTYAATAEKWEFLLEC